MSESQPRPLSRMLIHSIKGRLIVGVLLIHAILMGLIVVDLVVRQRDFMRQQIGDEGESLAVALAVNAPSWLIAGDLAALNELVGSLRTVSNLSTALILDLDGRVRAASDPALFNLVLDDPVSSQLLRQARQQAKPMPISRWHDAMVDTMAPVVAAGHLVGHARVIMDSRAVQAELHGLVRKGLAYIALAIAGGGAISWLLVHGMVRGLERLSRAADAIAAGDLSIPLDRVSGHDEVARLTRDFNQMLTALREDRLARDRAEAELFAEKEKALVTLHSIGDGVITTDTVGRVEYLNPVAEALTGWQNADAAGQPLDSVFVIVNEESRMPVTNPVAKAVAKNCVVGLANHTVLLARDGVELNIEDSAAPIRDRQGRIIGAVLVFHDVVRRRAMEREREQMALRLQRAEKMEALGLMAGGVAHDLNNILTSIVAYPDMLLLDLPEDSPQRQGLEIIRQAGCRMGEVVEDLLTVARGTARTMEPLSLNNVVRDYLASPECSRITASAPGVCLRSLLADELPPVSGSRIHLSKVLMNLAQNAVEALTGDGRVEIGTRLDAKGLVVLWVADSGRGIPVDDLPHIFEPFYSRKKLGRSGTGLGLAIVWNVVREHGGEIAVTSDDRGTRFELGFPALSAGAAASPALAAEVLPRGSGQSILVVDDEEPQRKLLVALLQRLGYEAEAAASGEEALICLRRQGRDLLLLDMQMGAGMNGRETYEAALAIAPGQKALLCSGYASDSEVERALALGVGGLIAKPFSMAQLAERVHAVLQEASGRVRPNVCIVP